ncbi:hypothetical protein ACM26W_01600 [Halomonas sp. HK25]|uniref:hypothetical protein n=1 Tax=Halomonas sp. HK25 TaxID=3394321 RepID=UPI0039FBD413
MALKSLLTRTAIAGRQAARKALDGGHQEGWSDGWHTQANTAESLRMLRDSAAGVAKSTAQTATTQAGWRRVAHGAGKVVTGTATLATAITAAEATSNHEQSASSVPPDPYAEGWQDGPEGFGYYSGGLRIDD